MIDVIDQTSWWQTLIVFGVVVVAVAAVLLALRWLTRWLRRHSHWPHNLFSHAFTRLAALLTTVGLWAAAAMTAPGQQAWWPNVSHAFLILTILVAAWFVSGLATFAVGRAIDRYSPENAVEPVLRRRRTQLTLVRRLIVVLVTIVAIGAVLLTFPSVRTVGASVLASAGIISIVAGLAAQSTLGNLIAGVQLAFSDAVRVGDVVVVEGEWGTIGEITLSYVVVHIWDERRLVLPCTYFTHQPFETWTRRSDKVLGTVFMDLDWRVPVEEARAKFHEIIEATPLWDRRTASALVTDAQGGHITMRFVVSAADSGDQWSLRCHVREQLVTWLQAHHPLALPTTRVRLEAA